MKPIENISFYNLSSSAMEFLEQSFPTEDKVIVLAIDTSGTKENLLLSFEVKNLFDRRFQNIFSSFENDGYELNFYLGSNTIFSQSEKGFPLNV